MQEWEVSFKCKRCGTPARYKIVKGKLGSKKSIGCKDCHLNTVITIKAHRVVVGDLVITVSYPYWYC